jgi:hypothetical protein
MVTSPWWFVDPRPAPGTTKISRRWAGPVITKPQPGSYEAWLEEKAEAAAAEAPERQRAAYREALLRERQGCEANLRRAQAAPPDAPFEVAFMAQPDWPLGREMVLDLERQLEAIDTEIKRVTIK